MQTYKLIELLFIPMNSDCYTVCNAMSSSVHKIMLPLSPTFGYFSIFIHSGSH